MGNDAEGGRLNVSGFRKHRRSGRCVATFAAFEADLLRSLAGQLIELLRNEEAAPVEPAEPGSVGELEQLLDSITLQFSGPTTAPEDPVLARLFPTAYADDEESAADFRRFTESTLRQGKAAAAATVIDCLEEAGLGDEPEDGVFIDVELDPPTAQTWLRSFTDMRLAIGTRLEVEEDDEDYWESLSAEDPRGPVHDIYLWLGYLQETLVAAVIT